MKNKSVLTRRRFIALGTMGTAGVWTGCSDSFGARFVRGFVDEFGRPIAQPKSIPTPHTWNENGITATWLGHASVLLNFYGVSILTDPVLMHRIGAGIGIVTLGPKRLVAPALTTDQLPRIDLVLLSHAHFDHFDLPTLKALPGSAKVVTAKRTADLLKGIALSCPKELSWGDRVTVSTDSGDVEVEAFQVRHWGARWRRDRYRGYNGYILSREGKKIIFGGDTAMSDTFRSLRSKGPFELAIMPIGSYKPFECSHCTPEQAVRMANDAGAKYFLPVHHKTFTLGREGPVEPVQRLEAVLEGERIALRDVGETFMAA